MLFKHHRVQIELITYIVDQQDAWAGLREIRTACRHRGYLCYPKRL